MRLVFTDLDGTLLDARTYSFEPAREALERLRSAGIPVLICTSKTRGEVEYWRAAIGINDPFIVENGACLYIPQGSFSGEVEGAVERDGYQAVQFGTPRAQLVEALRGAALETGCRVLGFSEMTPADIALRTCLTVRQAELANQREFDEPFEIVGSGTHALLRAIEARGFRWTRGNRFYHITGEHDKATAVSRLTGLFRQEYGTVMSMGLGDSHNDESMLSAVDLPVIVRSQFATVLKASIPRATVTRAPAPYGWAEAVMEFLSQTGAPVTRRAGARIEAGV